MATTFSAAPAPLLTPRRTVATVFTCFGLKMGLWGGSAAEVIRVSGINSETVGAAYVGFAAAAIFGMALAGKVAKQVNLKTRLLVLLALEGLCLVALFQMSGTLALIAGLFIFSTMSASVDLVMNSEAVAVEHDVGKPILLGLHGLASIGLALGSLAGSYVSERLGLNATALVAAVIYMVAMGSVLLGTPDRGATHGPEAGSAWFRPTLPLIVLGIIVGTSIAGETAVIVFSAKALAEQAPHLLAWVGAAGMAYALCQGVVRLMGDQLRIRFGDRAIIRASIILMTVGLALVALSHGPVQSVGGFILVGLGTACLVPCGFALASRTAGKPAAAAISMLSIIGAPLRVLSPWLYGIVAGVNGYTSAFSVYAVMAAAAALLVLAMMRPSRMET